MDILNKYKITPIDLVCVNLYPFKETIERNATLEEAIENIDIGGPSMLRSASKNYKSVTVLCDPLDYAKVINEIKEYGDTLLETRLSLAAKVYRHTASYDTLISSYLTKLTNCQFSEKLNLSYDLVQTLRYGENPHQNAALYKGAYSSYSIVHAKKLQGKELSYNNIQDANACLSLLREFEEPTAIGLKHMNPCGVSSASDIITAWDNAYNADPVSIYGGIVAFNRVVSEELAKDICMQIAAAKPEYLNRESVPAERVEKEMEILKVQAMNEGKPAEIAEKMVQGRIGKFYGEICLLEQDFVKNPDEKVQKFLEENGTVIKRFARIEKGEGLQKREENFAEEVANQLK
jgi:AICAR transformylase/IMP cyclohydrolase PurH